MKRVIDKECLPPVMEEYIRVLKYERKLSFNTVESYENNLSLIPELEKIIDAKNHVYLESEPRMMMELLDYLRSNYGSAKEYLISCGFDEEKIMDIIENFTI